ncbi:MAG TPA: transcriptional regulator NrdR [Gammaproteobacteria bacterium]|nr:transcriptional regulator NrdR [Gammaproteobacteria bacterium]
MRCPSCTSDATRVIDSRLSDGGDTVRRRRACQHCDHRFTTFERLEVEQPRVIKSDGRCEAWDDEKLRRGIMRALEKRPVGQDHIESLLLGISKSMRLSGEREVRSSLIGQFVMESLREIDEVAYVRYASVYRSFEDVSAFADEVERLRHAKEQEIDTDQLSLLGTGESVKKA